MKKLIYAIPRMESYVVTCEQGFAGSITGTNPDGGQGNGGETGDNSDGGWN